MMAPASVVEAPPYACVGQSRASGLGLSAKFFEIRILISKFPVSKILRATGGIRVPQLSCNQYFARFDSKKYGGGTLKAALDLNGIVR